MHGVKRQRPGQRDPEDVARAKAAKERARIEEYTGLRRQLASFKSNGEYSETALRLTTQILLANPEYPSGWAYRRRVLAKGLFLDRDEQAIQVLLEGDLDLTSQCLKRNPKEYAVWEHRKWVLKTMPDPDWRFELKTVEALLEKDARNFHGWDYRRYLIKSIQGAPAPPAFSVRKRPKPSIASELAYTTDKISASFSNYSAWHYRSKLLAKLWEEKGQGPEHPERKAKVDEEFDLVKQALYTDPDDQSAWIYHRWLVADGNEALLRREIAAIEELAELEPESKWCLDSLVFYDMRLCRILGQAEENREIAEKDKERLRTLQRVDPLRKHRYRDVALQVEQL